jgi:hypothetical protein
MTQHRATFAPPVFASRVLRARLLIEASGKRFVWDESKQKFVLKRLSGAPVQMLYQKRSLT